MDFEFTRDNMIERIKARMRCIRLEEERGFPKRFFSLFEYQKSILADSSIAPNTLDGFSAFHKDEISKSKFFSRYRRFYERKARWVEIEVFLSERICKIRDAFYLLARFVKCLIVIQDSRIFKTDFYSKITHFKLTRSIEKLCKIIQLMQNKIKDIECKINNKLDRDEIGSRFYEIDDKFMEHRKSVRCKYVDHNDKNVHVLSKLDRSLDSLYASFEDQFRGTREDIKERLRVYLPYVIESIKKTNSGLVLDLGCGRGEWLELLKEHGINAIGVDINRIMLSKCEAFGLTVTESDIIDYLRRQRSCSFSVVTAFHIVEHLPFITLVEMFDECLRILEREGTIIVETPNIENILVGTYYFYLDPTHRNPIPHETLSFVARERGFKNVRVQRINKNQDFNGIIKDNKFAGRWFCSEMDYALIAHK